MYLQSLGILFHCFIQRDSLERNVPFIFPSFNVFHAFSKLLCGLVSRVESKCGLYVL